MLRMALDTNILISGLFFKGNERELLIAPEERQPMKPPRDNACGNFINYQASTVYGSMKAPEH